MLRENSLSKQTNRDRAACVEEFILAYGSKHEPDQEDIRTVLVDFLADLIHLLDIYDISWDGLIMSAQTHHYAEVEAEKDAGSELSGQAEGKKEG